MSEVLTKLKAGINKALVAKFEYNVFEEYGFFPINMKGDNIFVALTSIESKPIITEFLSKTFKEAPIFVQVPLDDFKAVIALFRPNVESVEEASIEIVELEELAPIAPLEAVEPVELISEVIEKDPTEEALSLTEEQQVDNLSNQLHQIHFKSGTQSGKKIGQIFLEAGYINEVQLVEALATSKKTRMPLSSTLYKMNLVSIEQLKEVLSAQKGMELVSAEQLNVQEKVLNILSEDFIKTNKVIPLSSDGKTLTIGMVNPDDKKAVKDIIYLTGQRTKILMLTHFEFENCVNNFYGSSKRATKEIIQQLEDESLELDIEESLWDQVERELSDSTGGVAKFTNKIITDAIDTKASDIHIEPRLANYVVRYRTFGILKQVVEVPNKVEQQIITRFKVLARMNIAEHRRPQDGTFSIKYKGSTYDFRINTLPVGSREKVVIRVLAPPVSLASNDREIEIPGGTVEDIEKIKKMTNCPNGVILTSGPTGSGKTTTLYSVLKSLNAPEVNITTIEDPIEIKLEGVNQSQVNPKAGITFASCMRAILRQDPDIILVGEIRDYETLEVAISAALTGHLVLSTVHTNSAAATITRLIEMGAKDYLVASTLSGVIAQRLVRKLCPKCREAYYPSREEAELVLLNEEEIQQFTKTKVYRKRGCDHCDFTGYNGRLGVFEIMMVTKEIKKLIASGAHDLEIEDTAVKHNGMITLNQACLNHIKKGETTTDEFVRVLGIASE